MINKLRSYKSAVRGALIAACALALVVTLTSALSSDAWADGPARRAQPQATASGQSSSGKAKKKTVRFAAKPVTGVVNINTATQKELEKLPGIGPSKARRVVEYRAKKGPFRRVRDLRRVKGIGRKTVEKMNKHLSVKGPTTIR